jgi:LacI family transcriptional regulator
VPGDSLPGESSTTPVRRKDFARDLGLSVITVSKAFRDHFCHFVGANDEYLGYIATPHLIEIGCRRIAHLSTCKLSPRVGRLADYERALTESGLALGPGSVSNTTIVDGIGPTAGCDAAKELLPLLQLPDAIFC